MTENQEERNQHKQIQSISRYWSCQTWSLNQTDHDSLYLLRYSLAGYYKASLKDHFHKRKDDTQELVAASSMLSFLVLAFIIKVIL